MQEWGLGLSAAKVALTLVGLMCGGLAVYVRLTIKGQLADFLKELDGRFVHKDVYDVRDQAIEQRLKAVEGK